MLVVLYPGRQTYTAVALNVVKGACIVDRLPNGGCLQSARESDSDAMMKNM
ncbi:hypothetical protein DPMN_045799 [Dreissena polymorpha]|uniref:Uncharacterized protein n=1 Tax=Dreissena polymorpha TaxID=45954 RepID=A0A9D4D6Q5_DREPO|nr:hypothetical protein DPMN_045799 [Dreissena polymorpha]